MNSTDKISAVPDLNKIDLASFKRRCVGCLVLTQDNKVLLQQRDSHCQNLPGFLSTFGGSIEKSETPIQTLQRELKEELGANVTTQDVISLGAITEAATNHTELVYLFFWHDKHNTITGCYEGEARFYENESSILKHPKVGDDVHWLLAECRKRKLI